MQGLPHDYTVNASSSESSNLTLKIENTPDMEIAPPANFGGPGDLHSPEDLQTAAVASCFILSFKAIARASKLEWENLEVEVVGTLDVVERVMQFTAFNTRATLTLPADGSRDKATRLLEKAEQSCLVTNSLKSEVHLEIALIGGE
jgi:peroxiredoxin-like protein